MAATQRWRLTLEYDGSRFVGWQVQPNGPSVQGALQDALEALLGHPTRVSASGRTDAGVHAWGQVASFETSVMRTPRSIRDGLNSHLPDDIACVEAEEAPADFDPRRWTRSKLYRYSWSDRRARSPLLAPRVWHVPRGLDAEAMHQAAQALQGRHDFTSFRAAGCSAAHPMREILGLEVRRCDHLVELDVTGNGFLRHMVRIIAGTLTEVGRGKQPSSWPGQVLAARDRARAGRTAPARGLALVSVSYGEGAPPWIGSRER